MRLLLAFLLSFALAVPVAAKPPLRDVKEIDDGLMLIAIADDMRKTCDGVSARMIRALSYLNDLKARARALGYSDTEIEDYVTSKAEKKRMRSKAETYLASRGVAVADKAAYCTFAKAEIAKGSAIGQFLR